MIRSLFVLCLVGSAVGVPAAAQPACTPLRATPSVERAFRDSVAVATGARYSGDSTVYEATVSSGVAVSTSQGCQTAFTLNSDDYPRPFMGAVFIVDSAEHITASFPRYPSPIHLVAAGRDRVAFEFVTGEGSGAQFSDVAVLCSFGTGVWTECLEEPLRQHLWVQDGIEMDLYADFAVRDPYLYIYRHGRWSLNRDGEAVKEGTIASDTVRFRLP